MISRVLLRLSVAFFMAMPSLGQARHLQHHAMKSHNCFLHLRPCRLSPQLRSRSQFIVPYSSSMDNILHPGLKSDQSPRPEDIATTKVKDIMADTVEVFHINKSAVLTGSMCEEAVALQQYLKNICAVSPSSGPILEPGDPGYIKANSTTTLLFYLSDNVLSGEHVEIFDYHPSSLMQVGNFKKVIVPSEAKRKIDKFINSIKWK